MKYFVQTIKGYPYDFWTSAVYEVMDFTDPNYRWPNHFMIENGDISSVHRDNCRSVWSEDDGEVEIL